MATILPKKKPVIQKGEGCAYDPAHFPKESHFIEATAEEVLKKLKPYDFKGRKLITFDTETYGAARTSHQVPETNVRRWVGTGKLAKPQDFPFSVQLCDGTHSFAVYEDFDKLAPIFEDSSIEKVAHNAKRKNLVL